MTLNIPAVFRAGIVAGLHVEKRGYSHGPWRIVASDGQELGAWRTHPWQGVPPYEAPLAFARKRDADAALADIRAREIPS